MDLVNLADAQLPDLAVITVHRGGPKGKGLLERLKSTGVEVIECAAVKSWELPQFVSGRPNEPIVQLMQLPRRRWWMRSATIYGPWRRRSHSCSQMARVVRSPSIKSAAISVAGPR